MEVLVNAIGLFGATVLGLAVFALLVLGLLMPLAVFGIKPLLRVAIEELRKTNRLLARQGMRDQGIDAGGIGETATSRDDSAPQSLQDFIRDRDARS
ncbi:hypothetical protein [Stenotrophomonas maltophilia]|uniref:hypothetical protein n=1 Tax=Stenotrophomonas maltophilia TaxID=40324 RepID=UPI0015DD837A|nr:hypothetical protein [Stenotrophomonas maltophilia]MBA0362750.1 hypothetical protein [Stenotrophomonas maltophilia]